MRYFRQTWMSVVWTLLLTGCALRGNHSVLESELRQQEDRVRELSHQLKSAQDELMTHRKESESLRGQLVQQAAGKMLPEQSDVIFRASAIKFNTFLTSGVDRDGIPGDELLSVMVIPQDAQGHHLRLPAAIELEALDLNADGPGRVLGKWNWSLEESAPFWHSGFLAEGYHLEIPWKFPPRHPQVTVHARLSTPDGRQFSATQTITVRLGGGLPAKGEEPDVSAKTVGHSVTQTAARGPAEKAPPRRPKVTSPKVDDADENVADEDRGTPVRDSQGNVQTSDRFRSFDPPRFQ